MLWAVCRPYEEARVWLCVCFKLPFGLYSVRHVNDPCTWAWTGMQLKKTETRATMWNPAKHKDKHTCTPLIFYHNALLIPFIPYVPMFLRVFLQTCCWPGHHRLSHSHGQPLFPIHFRTAWKSICKDLKHAWEYHTQHEFIFVFFNPLRHCCTVMLLQTETIFKMLFVGAFKCKSKLLLHLPPHRGKL